MKNLTKSGINQLLSSALGYAEKSVMYTGQQQNWPTQQGASVITQYAVPIYWRSHPDRPYSDGGA
jgi:hypothetical protein